MHETKSGERIPLTELEDDHLNNIIRRIKRISLDGLTLRSGGGTCPDDFWMEEETIYGKEVEKYLKIDEYLYEQFRRCSERLIQEKQLQDLHGI